MKRWLRTAVSVAFVALALYVLDWTKLGLALRTLSPPILLLAVVLAFGQFLATGLRWHQLVREAAPESVLSTLAYYMYGSLLNAFTPANIGGDVYRFVYLSTRGPRRLHIVAALFRERVIGLFSFMLSLLLLVLALSLADQGLLMRGETVFAVAAGVSALGVLGFLSAPILTRPLQRLRLVQRRARLSEVLQLLRDGFRFRSPAEFAVLMGLSLLALLAWISAVKVVAVDLELDVPWIALGTVAILVEVIRLVPVSIQGIGVREGLYAYLLGHLGHSPESGFLLGAIGYIALNLALVLAGFVGWAMMRNVSGGATARRSRFDGARP